MAALASFLPPDLVRSLAERSRPVEPPFELRWLRGHQPIAIPPEVMSRLDDDGSLRPIAS